MSKSEWISAVDHLPPWNWMHLLARIASKWILSVRNKLETWGVRLNLQPSEMKTEPRKAAGMEAEKVNMLEVKLGV